MTRWIEDPSLDAPDGHLWVRPAPEDCPRCPCHTAIVCDSLLWRQADQPTHPDGTEYTEACPCEQAEEERPYNVAVTVDGQQYVVGATFWCGSLRTERVWDGIAIELYPERPSDDATTEPDEVIHAPVPLAMVLALPQAIGTAHADQPRSADPFGRDGLEWVQFPDALHDGTRYVITGLHPEAGR
jgi:hypothetical protein